MEEGILSSLTDSAIAILNRAQPTFDGGIFLAVVNDLNLSSLMVSRNILEASFARHIKNVLLSGGYLLSILCTLFWIFTIVVFVLVLFSRHFYFKKKITSFFKQALKKNPMIFYCFLFAILMLAIIPLIIAFIVNVKLHANVSAREIAGGSNNKNALLYKVNDSVKQITRFMKEFSPQARKSAKPVIDEIIRRAMLLTLQTRENFQHAYKADLGVTNILNVSTSLTEYISQNYYALRNLSQPMFIPFIGWKETSALDTLAVMININKILSDAEDYFSSLKPFCSTHLASECEAFEVLLKTKKIPIINTNGGGDSALKTIKMNAVTFTNALERASQTPDKIKEKAEEGNQLSETMEQEMYAYFEKEINVTEIILNASSSKWDQVEVLMKKQADSIEMTSSVLLHRIANHLNYYENLRHIIVLVALLMLVLIIFYSLYMIICKFTLKAQCEHALTSKRLKILTSLLFIPVIINLVMTTVIFLLSGYLQTQVCRYLNENPPLVSPLGDDFNTTRSSLQLDIFANRFVKSNWKTIDDIQKTTSSSLFQMPKPRDMVYGIKTFCRNNGPIMLALNALESFNMSSVNDEALTKSVLAKGKRLMRVALLDSDPIAMMPTDTESKMAELNYSVNLFILSNDYDAALRQLDNETFFLLNVNNVLSEWEKLVILLHKKSPPSPSESVNIDVITKELTNALYSVKEMERARFHIKQTIVTLKRFQNITPLIDQSVEFFRTLKKNAGNKTHMIDIALKHYDTIIEESTLVKANDIAQFAARDIMNRIGQCEPIYKAFESLSSAMCDTLVRPLAAFYFSLGWSLIFFTLFLMLLNYLPSQLWQGKEKKDNEGTLAKSQSTVDSTIPMLHSDSSNWRKDVDN